VSNCWSGGGLADGRCQALQMIKYYKGGHIIHLTDAVLEQHRKSMMKQRITIDPTQLKWKP